MTMMLSEELEARGFVNQCSAPTVQMLFDTKKRVVYHGIDPSADSAHAGNFVNWMLLRHLVQHGHTVLFLVGGGTGMIGDPKPDKERTLSDPEEVAIRVSKLRSQAERLLGENVQFVNNYDWLKALDLISFLRDIGKHFTVNELIKKDAIATRLSSEVGLSYTEFAYPLLQAYDYLMLHQSHRCDVQVGGSDQWGNIIAGVDLVRRMSGNTVYAFTTPLIVDKTTGKKFGKSEGNAVWLDAEKTSPYEFFQFWYNTSDENVVDYLKLFTLVPLSEIKELEHSLLQNPGARTVQRRLATEVTSIVHGEELCKQVAEVSSCLFGDTHLKNLNDTQLTLLRTVAPFFEVKEGDLIIDILVTAGLATSKREARTFLEGNAVTIHGEKVNDSTQRLTKELFGPLVHIRRGKKHIAIVALN